MNSPILYKISALSEVTLVDAKLCIDWAVELMMLGYETPNLIIVAGCTNQTSFYELKPYLEKAMEELGITKISGEAAIICYCSSIIQAISEGENVKGNLSKLSRFCEHLGYGGVLHNFSLLIWAWDDIDYDDRYPNHYWPEANKENIEEIVKRIATVWLIENYDLYNLQ